EVPYRTMIRSGYDNLITEGRSVSGVGYAWDVLRVIPPAIITGQAAGDAVCLAIDDGKPVYGIDVGKLQKVLESENVMIHYPA
ncbi:MAG: FAD-dependent oxidoreductase, partial [Eubacteriales bacterium]